MGMDISAAYHQLLTGGVSSGAVSAAAGRSVAAGSKAKTKADASSSGVKAEFSSEGLAALNRAKTGAAGGTAAANEGKLSEKAKKFLDSLREKYGDYDFMVGDEKDDLDDLMSGATKEFSVVLSNEELEKMADDEDYAKEKMAGVEKAVEVAKKLAEEIGAGEVDENGVATGTFFNRFGITIGDDGTISIFAELERISARQRENMEETREARAEEKKEAEKEAAEKDAQEKAVDREDYSVKLARIEGTTAEELIERFKGIDWEAIAEA